MRTTDTCTHPHPISPHSRRQTRARRALVAALVCATGIVGTIGVSASSAVAVEPDDTELDKLAATEFDTPEMATDQLIVTLDGPKRRLDDKQVDAALGKGASVLRELDETSQVVKLADKKDGADLDAAMKALAEQPGVVAVEPDMIMQIDAEPDHHDLIRRTRQWNLYDPPAVGIYGVNALPGTIRFDGPHATAPIAVIDTGYVDHIGLNGRFVPGYDFVSATWIANDGDGWDSDPHDPGDWTNGECGNPRSSSWHGTHVAGIIAAERRTSDGMWGVDQISPLVPVRVLGKCGGYASDVISGMRWAAGLPVVGAPPNRNPARVISMSLGTGAACPPTWRNTINAINARGVVVVASAGNSASNAGQYTPAGCPGVITVAATGKRGHRSYYSNYGTTVEIAAPGGDRHADSGDTILSTVNSGTTSPIVGGDTYRVLQGTSMAAPHVSAVAAMVLSVQPNLAPADVAAILQHTATPFPAGSTCQGICGRGVVNAGAAVNFVRLFARADPIGGIDL